MAEATRFTCENGHTFGAGALPSGARFCEFDRSPLHPSDGTFAAAAAALAAATGPLVPARAMRIVMEGLVVTVERGEQQMLGRDPFYSEHADFLAGYANVSRRHAVLRLDPDGRAWITDCYSTNLTRVSGEIVGVGREHELRHGDQVRLCANLAGSVELVGEASGGA